MQESGRTKHSISAHLSWLIIAMVSVVFLVTFGLIFGYAYKMLKEESLEKTNLAINKTVTDIEETLLHISRSVDNIKTIIEKRDVSPEVLPIIMEEFITNNPNIMGSAIVFEPLKYHSNKGHFAPYIYTNEGKVTFKYLDSIPSSFVQDWYLLPKTTGENVWTDPYYDFGASDMMMCTYSSVMRNEKGEFIGVVTADITLDWLCQLVENAKPLPSSYALIIDKQGTYIAHHQHERINKTTIFEVAKTESNPEVVTEIAWRMVAGESGNCELVDDGKDSYAFFRPVTATGWSMAIFTTIDDIFADLMRTSRYIALVALIGIVLIFICCRLVIKHSTAPLIAFADSAERIARGDFEATLPKIKSKDEMRVLHDAFDYMKHELVRYTATLRETTSEKEKIESELRIASNIQMSLLPKTFPPFPERTDIDIYAMLRPAKEVGGDLYDFFINEEKLFFAIGDVAGKGVPASLLMAATRSLFRSMAPILKEPQSIVGAINRTISETNEENMFVTMFVGILDLKEGVLSYCNAGHNPPCVMKSDGVVRFMELKKHLPIGVFPEVTYTNQKMPFGDGDALFLYTDGLTEAENGAKELFGEQRLLEVLEECKGDDNSRKIIDKVLAAVEEHAHGVAQSDDLAMLAVAYRRLSKKPDFSLRQFSIANQVAELSKLAEFVDDICEERNLGVPLSTHLNLALEEIVSNIIFYAYPESDGNECIEVQYSGDAERLTFRIIDTGVAFDPTRQKEVDTTLPIDRREIGGLGIHLTKKIMTSIAYERSDGKNILTLTKVI